MYGASAPLRSVAYRWAGAAAAPRGARLAAPLLSPGGGLRLLAQVGFDRPPSPASLGALRAPLGGPGPGRHDVQAAWRLEARGAAALRRRVDPERPKKPLTSYMRFLADFRSRKPEDLAAKEVMKVAATEWKQLPADKRKPYEVAYEAEREAYKKSFEKYVSSGKKDAFKRDPEKPKRPLTGFIRFVAEKRKAQPDVKATDLLKLASVDWKAMSEAQRKPYIAEYELDKARHAEDLKAYKASGKEEEWKSKVGLKTLAEEKAEKEAAAEKKKAEAEKRKAAAEKTKLAAKKKKEAAAAKKTAAAAKKRAAAEKKKAQAAALRAKEAETGAKKKAAEAAASASKVKKAQEGLASRRSSTSKAQPTA